MNREQKGKNKKIIISNSQTPIPNTRVCIIGMGLIGGSLGMALKGNDPHLRVTAVVRKLKDRQKILSLKAADEVTTDLIGGIQQADWIILASPPSAFETLLKKIVHRLTPTQIVTDVGSIKSSVMKTYQKILGHRIPYIGSHPIAGSEKKGFNAAKKGLFQGAPCMITPDKNTASKTLKKTIEFWKALGMKPIVKKPQEHDLIFAAISHLPHLISWSLLGTVFKNKGWISLAGEAWRDMTRIAQSSPELWAEIFISNRDNLLKSIQKFNSGLKKLEQKIGSGNTQSLITMLKKIQTLHKIQETEK